MLDKQDIAEASRTLHGHWRAGTKLTALDPSMRPRDRIEGYAIQAEIERTSRGRLFGWKIAATSEAGQQHINVAGPIAGRILEETVIANGGTAPMYGNEMRVVEPEFAFRMARDLPPRPSPYTVREALDAVETLHPAFEIPDSRFADFVKAGEAAREAFRPRRDRVSGRRVDTGPRPVARAEGGHREHRKPARCSSAGRARPAQVGTSLRERA